MHWLQRHDGQHGSFGALMETNNGSPAPNWVFFTIAILDTAAAMVLFVVLWKTKKVEPVSHIS